MRIKKIRSMIKRAVADEERTSRLANLIVETARQRGARVNAQQVQEIVQFVKEYIEHVPLLLEQAESAGKQYGLASETGQMLREIESYWFEADDLVPDHLGLVGLMDDAYGSLFLLQALSDYCQGTSGRPMLQQNLTAANQAMRGLIGDPVVSVLEQRVGLTVANAMMHRVMGQIAGGQMAFPTGPDPIWGNASMDEIVDARLGAMGYVR